MKLISKFAARSVDKVAAGEWYVHEFRGSKVFGMVVKTSDGNPAAFVFSVRDDCGVPWVATGDHSHTVLQLSGIELRPDLHSVHFNRPVVGELVSANDKLYMKGTVPSAYGDELTIDLSKGVAEIIGEVPRASFSRWTAGFVLDGKWETLFEYPKDVAKTA